MYLSITDDLGRSLGEMTAEPTSPWLSMMLFVSALWAANVAAEQATEIVQCLTAVLT